MHGARFRAAGARAAAPEPPAAGRAPPPAGGAGGCRSAHTPTPGARWSKHTAVKKDCTSNGFLQRFSINHIVKCINIINRNTI